MTTRWWGLEPPDMNGPEEKPLDRCWQCESEYQYIRAQMDDGMCPDCHEKAGEVFCGICNQWAPSTESADETTACDGCMNELHAEANRIDDERRYMESA